jgi:hypothetical protein
MSGRILSNSNNFSGIWSCWNPFSQIHIVERDRNCIQPDRILSDFDENRVGIRLIGLLDLGYLIPDKTFMYFNAFLSYFQSTLLYFTVISKYFDVLDVTSTYFELLPHTSNYFCTLMYFLYFKSAISPLEKRLNRR